jgi:hypothetical protein
MRQERICFHLPMRCLERSSVGSRQGRQFLHRWWCYPKIHPFAELAEHRKLPSCQTAMFFGFEQRA